MCIALLVRSNFNKTPVHGKKQENLKWCLSSMQNREALPSYKIQIFFRIISICYDRSHRFILRAYVNIIATRKEEWSVVNLHNFTFPSPIVHILWYHGTSGLVLWYRRFQKMANSSCSKTKINRKWSFCCYMSWLGVPKGLQHWILKTPWNWYLNKLISG